MSTNPIHPKGEIIHFKQHGKGSGVLQTIDIEGSQHKIRVEGHPAFGGKDSAPSPLDYVLGAFASCQQVTSKIVSLGLNMKLGDFDIKLESDLDNSVLVWAADGEANFSSVHMEISVETDADSETFDKFTSEIERRCPLTRLFVLSGVKVTSNWTNRQL